MTTSLKVQIGRDTSGFVLTGDTTELVNNRRAFLSLSRLNMRPNNGGVYIPFQVGAEISVLQQIQEILQKFGFENELSQAIKDDTQSYQREQENFKEFSEKARDIRNNRFQGRADLVHEFDIFQKTIKEKLSRSLYPLQLLSAYHMAFSQNACNFAVPGAGKTTIVLAAYAYLKSLPPDDPKHVDKLLVVGPLSSFRPWELEYRNCFGRDPDVVRLSGGGGLQANEKLEHLYSANPAEMTLVFHGGVERLEQGITSFLKRNKTMVVIDEAHRIKNPDGVWGRSAVEIGKEARSRIILTGTPVPNGYEDLFNLYQFLYPFKYKDILQFHYGNLVEMSNQATQGDERVAELVSNVSPYFIRIKKGDLALPPVFEHKIVVEMDSKQREIYDFIESKYIKSFRQSGAATVKDALNRARLVRLRQAVTDPSLLRNPIIDTLDQGDYELEIAGGYTIPDEFQDDSEIIRKILSYSQSALPNKFLATLEIVKRHVAMGEKVIVWTIFVQNAKRLMQLLSDEKIRARLLIGEIEQADRESTIGEFNDPTNNNLLVVVANPFSVAESISLHKGCHCAVYLERDYNCSNFLQSKDRIHRVGLSPNQRTDYYYVLCEDSIDEIIDSRLAAKVERMEEIIDDEIPLFTRLNDSDETDLIAALMEAYARKSESV